MRLLSLASILFLAHLPALAQFSEGSSRVEVWGLKDETRDEFEARHRAQTGYGLDGACMATLKGRMGYVDPGVFVFANPATPDSTTMLVTIGDVPLYRFPSTEIEGRTTALPDSWSTIREIIGAEPNGFHCYEFYTATALFQEYRRGDSASVAKKVASHAALFASFGDSLDRAKVNRMLEALVDAGRAPVEQTVDIYLHSDSLVHRSLAAHVLRNHLDDARAIEAFVRSLWDIQLGGDARKALLSYLRLSREDSAALRGRRVDLPFDGELVGAMLNHPNLDLCDLALEVLASDPRNEALIATALAGGATTLKCYLRSKLTKHSEFARDFRAEAIAALRRVSTVDHGADPERWIAWIDSFAVSSHDRRRAPR